MNKEDKPNKARPRFLIWIATSQCNLSCSHCYTARFGSNELSEEEKFLLVRDALKVGIKKINLTGGEILFKNNGLRLVNYIAEQGINLSVFTNGTTLTEEIIRELARNKVFVLLSLDGARKESHEKIRGKESWELAISAARGLREFGVSFAIVMSLNNQNYLEAKDYLLLAKDLGAKAGCFIPVMPAGRATKEMILKPKQIIEVLTSIDEAAERLKFSASLWCLPFARLIVKSKYVSVGYCRTSHEQIDIDPQGNVLLCDILDIKFSNVIEKGIYQAWKEMEREPLVESLYNPRFSEPCLNCKLNKQCRQGCFARAKLIKGEIYAHDPLCPRVEGLALVGGGK